MMSTKIYKKTCNEALTPVTSPHDLNIAIRGAGRGVAGLGILSNPLGGSGRGGGGSCPGTDRHRLPTGNDGSRPQEVMGLVPTAKGGQYHTQTRRRRRREGRGRATAEGNASERRVEGAGGVVRGHFFCHQNRPWAPQRTGEARPSAWGRHGRPGGGAGTKNSGG